MLRRLQQNIHQRTEKLNEEVEKKAKEGEGPSSSEELRARRLTHRQKRIEELMKKMMKRASQNKKGGG